MIMQINNMHRIQQIQSNNSKQMKNNQMNNNRMNNKINNMQMKNNQMGNMLSNMQINNNMNVINSIAKNMERNNILITICR